jgi:DNA polymerase I-like protein with 3'-5' exonuclease and polymerase domains
MGCSIEEAEAFAKAYSEGFKGIARFKSIGSNLVRRNGYIVLNPITGHKTYWWDWDKWCERQRSFTPDFWEIYRKFHKGTGDEVAKKVRTHFQAASKWDRKALNSVTQGTGAICLKEAARKFFEWIINNNYFDKVKIVNLVHDEICIEYPETMDNIPKLLETIMEDTAAIYCKSLPIPAEAAVGDYWIH